MDLVETNVPVKKRAVSKSSSSSSSSGNEEIKKTMKPGESYMQYAKRVKAMKTRKEEVELQEKELSIDQQMKISRDAAAKRKPYKDGDHRRARAAKNAKKDTRTDAQKMTDATGPRPGSRYRGD